MIKKIYSKAKWAEHKIRNLHNLHVEVKYDKPISIINEWSEVRNQRVEMLLENLKMICHSHSLSSENGKFWWIFNSQDIQICLHQKCF